MWVTVVGVGPYWLQDFFHFVFSKIHKQCIFNFFPVNTEILKSLLESLCPVTSMLGIGYVQMLIW